MAKGINYGQLMQKAFRQVIVDILAQVAREGLPGKHHFFITFDTTHPGVDMSVSLRERYPETMIIVLQEWFTDLAVMKDRFTVTLNFGNVPEPIVIPFDAILTFVDPSVEIGFRFDGHNEDEGWPGGPEGGDPDGGPQGGGGPTPPTPIKPDARPDGALVSLDKFRKS